MPKRRQKKASVKPLKEVNQLANILQTNKHASLNLRQKAAENDTAFEPNIAIKSLLDDEVCQPGTSSVNGDSLSNNTAALYNELDSFRQRWRREIEETKQPEPKLKPDSLLSKNVTGDIEKLQISDENPVVCGDESSAQESICETNPSTGDIIYAKAKKLFLTAVELEQDELHHESIRYYKQAMHLCPDIEKQIFREQCETSARENAKIVNKVKLNSETTNQIPSDNDDDCERISIFERIRIRYYEDNKDRQYIICKPLQKQKQGTLHISDLPHELILQIFRYVIGEELDLASLETIGLVCRGFYLLSNDASLWRSICYSTWGEDTLFYGSEGDNKKELQISQIDWKQMFLDRPRINYDGIYISRTRYIRQGDVGFQDITYRPFHVVRYYRYLRFFPNRRVLILTTNEEPDKIVPIFRHALSSKHFSPELSILDGTFEFVNENQINIIAEKDCRALLNPHNNSTRQAQFHRSRQTPITQKFNLKFELKTAPNKPYKNNVLKWLEYTILTRLETGQDITTFDLSLDTFPSLIFVRVKRFNLRLTNPLASH